MHVGQIPKLIFKNLSGHNFVIIYGKKHSKSIYSL